MIISAINCWGIEIVVEKSRFLSSFDLVTNGPGEWEAHIGPYNVLVSRLSVAWEARSRGMEEANSDNQEYGGQDPEEPS